MNQPINIQEIVPQAIELADSLCNALIQKNIIHMDPDSEFQLEKIKNPLERAPIYKEFVKLLANDSPIVLPGKIVALKTVVNNLIATALGLPSAAHSISERVLYEKFNFELNTDAIGYQFHSVLEQQQSLAETVFQNMLENSAKSPYTVSVERLHSTDDIKDENNTVSMPKKIKI